MVVVVVFVQCKVPPHRGCVSEAVAVQCLATVEVEGTRKSEKQQQQQQRVRVRRHKEGRSKCIFTVQDFGGLGAREQGSVGGDGSATAGEVAAGGGGAQRGTARSARRRCKVASGKRSAANQTMLKYLTHKLRTQSINDENQVNEKVSGVRSAICMLLAIKICGIL